MAYTSSPPGLTILEYLNKKGLIDYEVLNPGDITSEILKIKKFDLVFINKSCDKATFEVAKLINSLKIKIIYDLDDNIFEFPSYSCGSSNHNGITLEILRISKQS